MYGLVVAKGGLKMKESPPDPETDAAAAAKAPVNSHRHRRRERFASTMKRAGWSLTQNPWYPL